MNNKEWFEFAKAQKEIWVSISKDRGDMPPFVIAEKEGNAPIIVVAPQVDKYKALEAANLCRRGLACDALAIITDGYGIVGKASEDNYKLREQIVKKYESLQAAFLAGHKDVIEVITAIRYNPDGTMSMASIQYTIENKKVIWGEMIDVDEDEPHEPDPLNTDPWEVAKENKGPRVSGFVADSMRKIMKSPPVTELPRLSVMAEKMGLNLQQQLHHTGRAIRKILHQQNYLILECVPWSAREGYGVLLKRMKEKFDEIGDIYDVDNMETKPQFWQKYWPSMN